MIEHVWQQDDAGFRHPVPFIPIKRGKRPARFTTHVRPSVPQHALHPKQHSTRHGGTRSTTSSQPQAGEKGAFA